ncbi:universal stress protein [Streptomyces sp. NPDC059080]|uniref:universal stress protein n=1 Tax=Streptomyces sp. NPDC059080 TaxID=3346718 RepID=UPI00368FCC65
MKRPVAAGVNGAAAGLAAADWAAREALLRDVPLWLVHAWEWQPYAYAPPEGPEAARRWSEGVPHEVTDRLRRRHPGLEITAERVIGPPPEVLCGAATDAELLVIGTAGVSGAAGFLLGSVGMATVAHAERPVVLVRAGDREEQSPPAAADDLGTVVLGLDLSRPCDEAVRFAFEAAALRTAPLLAVHGGTLLPHHRYGGGPGASPAGHGPVGERAAMDEMLGPWRERYPAVDVTEQALVGRPAQCLLEASAHAALLVIGRHRRTRWPHVPHIGHVAHAVLHHSPAPVAVVPDL